MDARSRGSETARVREAEGEALFGGQPQGLLSRMARAVMEKNWEIGPFGDPLVN